MENVLKTNLDVLKEVSKMISDETGCNIIICDHEGEIIEATVKERIGRKHMGSKLILAGESDEAVINKELEQEYRSMGTDTLAGYNYVISILGRRVGSLGVAGEPDFLRPIVRVAAKTIGFYISEYLKEKEKNKILQKMAQVSDQIARQPYEQIDYQTFADDLLLISGAKFVFFDLFGTQSETSTIVALAGRFEDKRKLIEFMGFPILGCQRSNRIIHTIKNNGLACFNSIEEFPCNLVPREMSHQFQSDLGIGKVCSLEIAHDGKMVGDFIIFMPSSQQINNTILVELYAAQVGQLLIRVQAEAALKKSEAELKKAMSNLEYLSTHDSLTGIYNRNFFEREIRRINDSEYYPISIISLDVDGLKIINDNLGHDQGDKLLKNIAKVLKDSLRETDILTRIGGDEFVIILPKSDNDLAQKISSRIEDNIAQFNLVNPSLPLSVSLGMCTCDKLDRNLQEVLKKADKQMYLDKCNRKEPSQKLITDAIKRILEEGRHDHLIQ